MSFRLKYLFLLIILFCLTGCSTGPYIKVDKSIGELKKSVQENPNGPVAYYNLGVGYTAKKQYEKALDSFHKCLEIAPHFADAYFAIYCVEYAKDKELYSKALEEESTPEVKEKISEIDRYLQFALIYDPFFDWKISTILLEKRPSSPYPYTQALINRTYDLLSEGFRQFNLGNYAKAVKKLDLLIDVMPDFIQAYLIRGFAQAQLKKYECAIEDFLFIIEKLEEYNKKKVLPIYLNPAELYYFIGYAYLKQGDLDKAEDAFKKVIMENMGFYMAHYRLSNVCQKKGNYEGALKELNAAIIGEPNDPVFHYYKGIRLNQMRRDWEAMKEYKKAISINPKFPNPYYHLAMVLESVNCYEEAVEEYQNFIDRAPKQLDSFIEKAQMKIKSFEKEQILQED